MIYMSFRSLVFKVSHFNNFITTTIFNDNLKLSNKGDNKNRLYKNYAWAYNAVLIPLAKKRNLVRKSISS